MSDPILIIGAGISGLVLAQYLQSKGVLYQIFERDSAQDTRNGGWGLTLTWALPALCELLPESVVQQFPECFVNKDAAIRGDVGRFHFFDLKSGESIYNIPAAQRIRVNRGRLRQVLTAGINIQWNKNFVSMESSDDSITAQFEDGTSYTGRLLVASDGARSRARQILYPSYQMNSLPVQLLGASPLYSVEDMKGAQSIDPFIFMGTHPDTNIFLFFGFLDTPANFEESSKDKYHCQVIVSWDDTQNIAVPDGDSERIALMKKLTADWAEPFRSLVHNLPDDIAARSIRIEDWMFHPNRTHVHQRTVLMGDSAHTMTMYRGEGANNSIIDVQDLVKIVDMTNPESFKLETLAASLEAYERTIFTRVRPSLLGSRQACLDAHNFAKIMEGSPLIEERLLQ
ncbi:hypothetical protein N7495_000343 [Penicillium taxi]|uniref:uncharacterized protein n=1 Tax=Penicillium taxi TaxID=168475 RepID=UPI0025456FFC|nr:uncharacterized protein N7495_000343 [Penicillium taxi]KAJ5907661.1 hypothetical protein N7495_000343 [Penicillium taxi]